MSLNPDKILPYLLNPCLAHTTFFGHRHSNADAPFHEAMERDWHSSTPNILTMAFRGSAKSTKAEEAITLQVCFGRVKNVLILGESETRAVERLTAVKHHLEYDGALQETFSVGPGDVWTETRAVTNTGVMIQAAGRGQSLRGVKHLDNRPDYIFLDDIEDKESGSVSTPEARAKTRAWLAGTVIPTLTPGGRMRMAATPLHPEALAPTLAKADQSWVTRTYPIIYKNENGEWQSAWPDRFPLEIILRMRLSFEEIGEGETFAQEYLCEAIDASSRTFTEDMFQVVPRTRSWHAVYAIYDPARTTNKKSATTGKVVASWINHKLVVWESAAKKWMPDEIVSDIFSTCETYSPVAVGVEQDGLHEWLLQPIRTRQVESGQIIPLRPLKAPKGKLDFIRGLQPYFNSRSVEFANDLPELRKQLLGFPNGDIDAPNALAYMLVMRLGTPIYDNFSDEFISDVALKPNTHIWLLVNTNNNITTGILVQFDRGQLRILWDAIFDGDAGTVLTDLLQSVQLALSTVSPLNVSSQTSEAHRSTSSLRLLCSPRHFDEYTVYGLRAAGNAIGHPFIRGGDPLSGREEIRNLLRRPTHGERALVVSKAAEWTLRAFAGGYAREPDSLEPIDSAYSILMEPLESFAATLRVAQSGLVSEPNWAYTVDGRRYISALAASR